MNELILPILGYWILIVAILFVNFSIVWRMSNSPLNYKTFKHWSYSGQLLQFVFYIGLFVIVIQLFIGLTEFWFEITMSK